MNTKPIAFLVALSISTFAPAAEPTSSPEAPSKHIAKIISGGDGSSEQTAYKVASVHDEYEVLAALGLTTEEQSLVVKKKPYDVLKAKDPRTGSIREIWFDISSFYPEF